ncbi:NADP-dependent 3-hydroxy acid dehydrogenase [Trichomonascus vanleenenianus]|uniref:SDR family NAD(P)-dependent oxidoreductase n=1 Tax=Trichomonascus vanleenenianus TaxID=2268995 RepID=UPI003EC96844
MVLANKTALITGGSRGIGLAIGKKFASQGANVILLARSDSKLKNAISELPKLLDTQSHSIVPFDLTSGEYLSDKHLGGKKLTDINILVNNAGLSQSKLLSSTKKDEILQLINTNLLGAILMTQSMIKPFIKNRGGAIVNISSVLAAKGLKGSSVYSATKAGIEAFTRGTAEELGSRNIRCNCLQLGLVDTDMGQSVDPAIHDHFLANSASGRLATVEDVAEAALLLATNQSINGSVLKVDGGYL